MDFKITWENYACYKKPHGCCNEACNGCCYTPPRTQKLNKTLDTFFLSQLESITPENSPCAEFHKLDPKLQNEICTSIKKKKAKIPTWALYFGEGNNIFSPNQPKK